MVRARPRTARPRRRSRRRRSSHYFVHGGFWDAENQLLENVSRLRHIPCTVVQGRYDLVCPVQTAWELHTVRAAAPDVAPPQPADPWPAGAVSAQRWPEAELIIVPDAGHSAREVPIARALRAAMDRCRDL